jgi:O-antigen/teichoic acid export membrane protein
MNATVRAKTPGGLVLRALAGAVVGAGATILFVELIGKRQMNLDDPGTVLAIIAGLSYALMGIFVGLGVMVPNTGARFLNVEDADELRDESPRLKTGAVICLLIGAFLLLLAVQGGISPPGAVTYAAAACLVAILVLGIVSRKQTEEMTRQMSLEASNLALQILLVLLACAALVPASIGQITPLALISGIALLELAAMFIVFARKGVLIRR